MIRNILVYTILIFCTLKSYAQLPDELPASPQERIETIKKLFDEIPTIILDEKAISIEQFAEMDTCLMKSLWFLGPPLSVYLAGDTGKKGIVYIHTQKRNYLPIPKVGHLEDGYYEEGDFPAEFEWGMDSLYSLIYSKLTIPQSVEQHLQGGYVTVDCYINEAGIVDSCCLDKISIGRPECAAEMYYSDNTLLGGSMLKDTHNEAINALSKSILEALAFLPQFRPATFYLRNVKYRKTLFISFGSLLREETEAAILKEPSHESNQQQ
ncbi:MAG: hypothetical protein MJZ36_10725 [Bacteroidaceae bacterium]|nr:hypothetical protein [Bacteroidaceae bacterium]